MNMADTAPILGIDFGTCQCSVAWFNPRSGQAELLRNAEGYEKTPSVVFYDKDKGDVLVGSAAEFMLDDKETNREVKMGIKHDIGKDILIHLGGKDRRPTEIAADILRKLKRDAEELHFKAPVTTAVVAHPAAFDATERERLVEAATLAGFERVILLSEPEAAAIAVSKAGVKVGNNLVVFDLGAGTFDLTVLLQTGDGNYRLPIGSRGKRCGGDDFDRALYDYCDGMARQQHGRGIAADSQVDPQFMKACRQRKENLSLRHHADFSSLLKGQPPVVFEHRVERAKFEELIRPLIDSTIRATSDLVEEAERAGYKPDSILLIGGSTRIPLIAAQLKAALPIKPVQWQQQDVAVALGAAIYGDLQLSKEARQTGATQAAPLQPASGPPRITDVDLIFHKAVIDAHAKKVHIHAAARIGLADGSGQPGIPVSFYVNGKPCIEIATDHTGQAILDSGIDPSGCTGGTNELVVRVDGCAKTSKASFILLGGSHTTFLYSHDHRSIHSKKYGAYYEYSNTEECQFNMQLAREDFVDVSGVRWSVALFGDNTTRHSATSKADGSVELIARNNYKWRFDTLNSSDNEKRGYLGLDTVHEACAFLEGFPPSFQLRY
jgi:actin-like ATPase involved in cell morphogenesis